MLANRHGWTRLPEVTQLADWCPRLRYHDVKLLTDLRVGGLASIVTESCREVSSDLSGGLEEAASAAVQHVEEALLDDESTDLEGESEMSEWLMTAERCVATHD